MNANIIGLTPSRVAARANAASKARTAVRSKYFFIDASLVFIMACHDLR